jgi:multiple sugar transport system permease protein
MQAAQPLQESLPSKRVATRRSQNRLAVFMIAPAVIVLLVMGLYPLLFAINVSLRSYMITRPATLGQWTGLQNFQTVFNDSLFWDALVRTGVFFLMTVPLQIVVGIGIALLLNTTRWQRLSAVLRVALVIPFAMTPAVVGLLGRLIYDLEFGVLNYLLSLIGLPAVNWFGDPNWALAANAITDIWQWTPFVALVMLSGLTLVPQDSIDAMRLESNSGWALFRFLQLPFLLPGLTAVLIIRTADILKLFDMPFILTRGGPGVSTEFISLYIQRVGFRVFDMGVASAQALVLLVLAIVLSRLYIRFFYREVSEA